jgi:hypothetical protein
MPKTKFLQCPCAYDSTQRSICLSCFEPMMAATLDQLGTMERLHQCRLANRQIIDQFPKPVQHAGDITIW